MTYRMFPVDKDTIMMIAVAIALLAIFYLYREVQNNKKEIQKLSDDLDSVPPPPLPPPPSKPVAVVHKKEKASAVVADETD